VLATAPSTNLFILLSLCAEQSAKCVSPLAKRLALGNATAKG
jgi:hypothetical protein